MNQDNVLHFRIFLCHFYHPIFLKGISTYCQQAVPIDNVTVVQHNGYRIYFGTIILLASARAFSGLENLKTTVMMNGQNVTNVLGALGIYGVSYGEQILPTAFNPFNSTLSLNLSYNSTYVQACPES